MSNQLNPSDNECIIINDAGVAFEELSCVYPNFCKLIGYSEFERTYDPVLVRDWMREHPIIPIIAVAVYGAFIVCGQRYFKDRNPLDWRKPLAMWNFSLSLFSFIGLSRTLHQLVHNLHKDSLWDNLCNDPESQFGSGSTGLWVQLFILSKFPELFDTLFIVVHKKPLIFLHWYHHVTVLLYCWHSYVSSAPAGLFFIVMNYGVHAIMYGYYFLMAIKMKPKWMNAKFITVAQISQMVVGVTVTLLCFRYYRISASSGRHCWVGSDNNAAACVMYGSYLFLFLKFFMTRYAVKKDRKVD